MLGLLMSACGGGTHGSGGLTYPTGLYAGTVYLVDGATPPCSSVLDANADCCDDAQSVALSVSLGADGYYVDNWPADVDSLGRLVWQETYDATDGACETRIQSTEDITPQFIYTYSAMTTLSCAPSVQTIQCAYRGQLAF